MRVGDQYRLEHIKLMLKQKRTVYGSDRAYLDHLIHDYIEEVKTQKNLAKIRGEDPFEESTETTTGENVEEDDDKDDDEDDDEDDDKEELVELEHIYCWKCGKSIPVNSKFCLDCGSDIKKPEVKEDPVEEIPDKISHEIVEKKSNNGNNKNILIVIGVLVILAIIGGAVVMNNGFEKTVSSVDDPVQPPIEVISEITESDVDTTSKCGVGTVFDDATNTCLLEGTQTTSKCGVGTVFDDATNTCLLK
jgi:hypothetical protein